jgi:D-alanyl-D-alanine carboxypeptidase
MIVKINVTGMNRLVGIIVTCVLAAAMPAVVWAAPGPYLKSLYTSRQDLQVLFDAKTYVTKPSANTSVVSLEDWAKQYGWREDKKLLFYKPKGRIPVAKRKDAAPSIAAQGYIVIDRASGLIIAEQNAGVARPIASLTKLMTADVVLSRKIPLSSVQAIAAEDQVGGSALNVAAGTKFTVDDLFYAAFLPSANDAANALANATKLSRPKFIGAMNDRAQALGLSRTIFADPTGIDEGNISTPREFALLADQIFGNAAVQRYSTAGQRTLRALPGNKKITVKSSDHLLTKSEFDDILVGAGKTGYLGAEVGWNLAVSVKSAQGAKRELTLVLFGEPKLAQMMSDAGTLARWAWGHYQWK